MNPYEDLNSLWTIAWTQGDQHKCFFTVAACNLLLPTRNGLLNNFGHSQLGFGSLEAPSDSQGVLVVDAIFDSIKNEMTWRHGSSKDARESV